MNYDANLFCEIIESQQGVRFIRQETVDGLKFRLYEGQRGLVILDYDDDNFTDSTGKGYLIQLGLGFLIDGMYPHSEESEGTPFDAGNSNSEENEQRCSACDGVGLIKSGNDEIQCVLCAGTGSISVTIVERR